MSFKNIYCLCKQMSLQLTSYWSLKLNYDLYIAVNKELSPIDSHTEQNSSPP